MVAGEQVEQPVLRPFFPSVLQLAGGRPLLLARREEGGGGLLSAMRRLPNGGTPAPRKSPVNSPTYYYNLVQPDNDGLGGTTTEE